MHTFTHRTGQHIDIDGARIYVETTGQAKGPALVLLHGGFGTMEDFNTITPALGRTWRLIGIDTRGHGMSTLGGSTWTYERAQKDVEQVLKTLGLQKFTLLGFSDGGIAALRLAALTQVHIDRLVVVGSTWHNKNLASSRAILSRVTPQSWREKFPDTYEAYQALNPEPDFDTFGKALIEGWQDTTASGHPGDAVSDIHCPALIVRGDEDHLTTIEDAVELSHRIKGAHLFSVPLAGHVAYDDQVEVFQAGLEDFLQQ